MLYCTLRLAVMNLAERFALVDSSLQLLDENDGIQSKHDDYRQIIQQEVEDGGAPPLFGDVLVAATLLFRVAIPHGIHGEDGHLHNVQHHQPNQTHRERQFH